jgi:hypothetical protein
MSDIVSIKLSGIALGFAANNMPEHEEVCFQAADKIERLRAEVDRLKAALRDCMDYVDVENITMQHKQARWQAVLNGGDWQPGNLGVEEERGDE